MAKNSSKDDGFLKIPHWYWECGLDMYEVLIIASIASWQRLGKDFFESRRQMANRFNCDFKVIQRRFTKLEKLDVIKRGDKKGRSYTYEINEYKLNQLKQCTLKGNVTSEGTIDESVYPERVHNDTSEGTYKNNKNITKNILREEGAFSAPSSEPKSALKTNGINSLALEQFIKDLNED